MVRCLFKRGFSGKYGYHTKGGVMCSPHKKTLARHKKLYYHQKSKMYSRKQHKLHAKIMTSSRQARARMYLKRK